MNYDEEPSPVCPNCQGLVKQLEAARKRAELLSRELRVVHGEKNALAARVAQLEAALMSLLAIPVVGAEDDDSLLIVHMRVRGQAAALLNSEPSPWDSMPGLDGKEGG